MKTPQQIREMAIKVIAHVKPEIQLVSESALKQTIEVIQYIQKDLLESVSEGADEWFLNHNWKPEELMSRQASCRVAWKAAKLSSKAQIDTLKQRELGYQSDLRQKDAEIERLKKLAYVGGVFNCPKCKLRLTATTISMTDGVFYENREPQQCSNGCGPMWMQTYKDEVGEARKGFDHIFDKYQEAVKDVEWIAQLRKYDTYTELDKLYAIQSKYGLNKKER